MRRGRISHVGVALAEERRTRAAVNCFHFGPSKFSIITGCMRNMANFLMGSAGGMIGQISTQGIGWGGSGAGYWDTIQCPSEAGGGGVRLYLVSCSGGARPVPTDDVRRASAGRVLCRHRPLLLWRELGAHAAPVDEPPAPSSAGRDGFRPETLCLGVSLPCARPLNPSRVRVLGRG